MAKKRAEGRLAGHGEMSSGVQLEREQFEELLQDRDRAGAIVLHCNLEIMLENLLRAVMISDKVVEELTKASFDRKVKLAYAFGLIPEAAYTDLKTLNEIRNKFAHQSDIRSFDHEKICTLCQCLSVQKTKGGQALEPYKVFQAIGSKLYSFLSNEIEVKQKVQAECRQKELEDDFRHQDLQEAYDGWNARYGYKDRAAH